MLGSRYVATIGAEPERESSNAELVKEDEVVSRRDPDGRTWLYRTVAAAT